MAGLFDLLGGGGDPNASGSGLFSGLGQMFADAQGNTAPALAGGPGATPPLGFMDAIGQNRNALVGLGLGLLTGSPTSKFGPAMQGYQQGAATDASTQARAQQVALEQQRLAYQKQQDAVVNALRQKQFEFSTMSDASRAARDLGLKPDSPEGQQFMTMYYRNKSGMQPVWGVVGSDAWQRPVYGWINPATQTATQAAVVPSPGGRAMVGQAQTPAAPTPAAAGFDVPYVGAAGQFTTLGPSVAQPTAPALAATNVGASNAATVPSALSGLIPPGMTIEQYLLEHPEIEPKELQKEVTKLTVQKAGTQQQMQQSAGPMINILDRAANLVNNANLPTTGAGGALLTKVPGTAAHDLGNLMDTIKANTAFDKLQEMRQNSPTGGALGQISNMEEQMLSKSVASLEQSQSKPQFLQNLAIVRDRYQRFHDSVNNPTGYLSKYGSPTTTTQAAQAPTAPSVRTGGAQLPRPATPTEALKLGRGTRIVLPDGTIGRVP